MGEQLLQNPEIPAETRCFEIVPENFAANVFGESGLGCRRVFEEKNHEVKLGT